MILVDDIGVARLQNCERAEGRSLRSLYANTSSKQQPFSARWGQRWTALYFMPALSCQGSSGEQARLRDSPPQVRRQVTRMQDQWSGVVLPYGRTVNMHIRSLATSPRKFAVGASRSTVRRRCRQRRVPEARNDSEFRTRRETVTPA